MAQLARTHRDLLKAAKAPSTNEWGVASRAERQTLKAAREVVGEVHLAAIEADGALALGEHIMRGVVDLDEERLRLAAGDPVLSALLGKIEARAIHQVESIQANLFTQW